MTIKNECNKKSAVFLFFTRGDRNENKKNGANSSVNFNAAAALECTAACTQRKAATLAAMLFRGAASCGPAIRKN